MDGTPEGISNIEKWKATAGRGSFALFDTSHGGEGEGVLAANGESEKALAAYAGQCIPGGLKHYIIAEGTA